MVKPPQKLLIWLGNSLDAVKSFSPEAVYVLHGFEKKTRRTPKADIDLANKRYRDLLMERKKK